MKLDSYSFSNIGGRTENQDAVGCLEAADSGIYVVADGLGGHQAGRVAADCVVNTMLGSWKAGELPDLAAMIGTANETVLAVQREKKLNTKSTVVALAVAGGNAVWAHTGDSRLYYLHDGKVVAYTEDHSVAYMKFKAGEITRAQIPEDEDQSSLLRAIGGPRRWEPDCAGAEGLTAGDGFLLCSDGAWEYLHDEEILVDHLKAATAKEWASLMLLRISERVQPGNDNLSLITVLVK